MRHQYIGVKHKIRISSQSQSQSKSHQFNWNDGVNHWGNFLNYKQVFGDVQIDPKPNCNSNDNNDCNSASCDLGFGVDESDDGDDNDGGDDSDGDVSEEELKRLGLEVLKLREVMVKREEKRREREFLKEKGEWKRDGFEFKRRECCCSERELELEMEMEMELRWGKKEVEKRVRLEKELEEEKRRRKKVEEKMEEEEMEWRERMVAMQIEHEKQMMQMHAEACHNQMQVLGVMARILCQFFGSGNDGLAGAGLGALPPQVLHHGGGLGSVKPDASSPSEFM